MNNILDMCTSGNASKNSPDSGKHQKRTGNVFLAALVRWINVPFPGRQTKHPLHWQHWACSCSCLPRWLTPISLKKSTDKTFKYHRYWILTKMKQKQKNWTERRVWPAHSAISGSSLMRLLIAKAADLTHAGAGLWKLKKWRGNEKKHPSGTMLTFL